MIECCGTLLPHSLLQLRTRIEPIALENDNQNAVKASQSNKQLNSSGKSY
jgi:hypothetical protein